MNTHVWKASNTFVLCVPLQVSAIFESSLEVMISVFGETPAAGTVSRACAGGGGGAPKGRYACTMLLLLLHQR
jgi:hypothetical protein